MTESQRNLLILLVVAVVGVMFSGAFGLGAGAAFSALNIAFTVLLVWFAVVLYQRHSGTIATMPAGPRTVLQAGVVVLLLTYVTGTLRIGNLLPPPFGWSSSAPLLFWGLVLGSGFAIWWAWQQRTSRW